MILKLVSITKHIRIKLLESAWNYQTWRRLWWERHLSSKPDLSQSYFWVDVKLFLVPCHTLFPHYIFSFLWNSTLFFPSNISIPPKFSLIKTWVPVTKHLLCTRHYASVSSYKEVDREERGKLFQYYFPTSRFAINIIFSAAKCRVLPASYCNPW